MDRRLVWPLLSALVSGCTCGSRQAPSADSGATSAPAVSSSASQVAAPPPSDLGVFSAPVAAARAGGGDIVAGLVASAGVVRVMGLSGGHATWTADPLRDLAWAPDADLRLRAAAGGFALVWRGPHAGRTGRTMVALGPHGEARDPPVEIGSAFCVTGSGVAWLDARSAGPARVQARGWAEASPRVLTSVPADRDPALVCADHDVIVLGDGDDDLSATTFTPGDAAAHAPIVAIRDADFGDDEEREHDAYSVGDDLGVVRVASSGAVAMREVPRGGSPTPWRKLKHTIPADDDVVAVDGDADATVIVYTEDSDETCPGVGATAESVHALKVVRKTGEETLLDLAPADCEKAPGPLWVAASPAGVTVGWVERRTKSSPQAPPIMGAAFRVLLPSGPKPFHIDLAADAVVDAGCDEKGCSIAALLRPAGGDAMQPGQLAAYPYP